MEIDEEAIITIAKELRAARPIFTHDARNFNLYINTKWDKGYSMGYSFAVAVIIKEMY